MDINELESYRLADAVKFNDQLNPRLWGSDEHLLPEVKQKLLAIADDFREFLGIDVEIKDITISGSNAAYTYTPHSDIDLHLVVDLPRADESEVYRELFDAKKYAYNDQHDFKIGGYDVELYVQDANKPHHSQGIYSLANDDWVRVPSRKRPKINDISVKSKYEDIGHRIEAAIASGSMDKMDRMAEKIRQFRQAGLDAHGEFGPENLAFKILRGNGTLEKLSDARRAAKDQALSLTERKRKKKFQYGSFGGYYFPGYGYYGQTGSAEAADGGDGSGSEDVKESTEPQDTESVLRKFIEFTAKQIGIETMPHIRFKRDPAWSARHNTFGRYVPEENTLYVSLANRHILDIMRTIAHELTHHRQNEQESMPDDSGETGSPWENEANAMAGIIMRQFSDLHPEYFGGREINETDTGQEPQPGDPIDWPEGTVHVKVSDVYDWYKLGQKLSDLKTARPEEFGTGVPETILVFNNEPQEEDFIDDLTKLGLKVHDVDPGETPGIERKSDVDESLRGRLGAAAAAACIAGSPGCATTGTDAIRDIQTIGRTAQTFKGMKPGDAREELTTAVKDYLRRGTGTRESVEEPTLDDPIVNYDIPYAAIARPERLFRARKFGRISHYERAGSPMAIISVPVSKERAFVNDMRTQGVQVQRSKVYEASGYIPTAAEKDDPRYKMALTVDVKPGQTGKEANKLGLETDSQGRPQLLMKRLANLLESVKSGEDLFEVKMSPGELEKWAKSPEAEGIQAGFEAELIFRDTARKSDEEEYEPDYEMDERASSIDQVVEFFQGGDNGISPRTANRLREALQEEFWDWQSEAINDAWEDDAEQLVRDYMETNVWANEQDQYRERAAEDLGIETSEESAEQSEQIEIRARELFDEDVEREINEQGGYWDEANEYFADMAREDGPYDEEAFLSDRYPYMTDIENAHGLDWPYWSGSESSGGGGREPQNIADSLESTLNQAGIDNNGVVASSGYHGTARRPGRWIIEPDGSLDPDDYEDTGLEVVSPPMPLPEAMRALRTVIDWANSNEGDAYTNGSTGLHMGVSIPHKGGDVDYVKLVLFMGDQHVLDQFGRAANTYCASALDKLRQTQTARRRGLREQDVQGWDRPASKMTGAEKTAAAMDLMRKNLIELAQRYVQDGVGQSKYTSAHMKDGYIEFRSPGGDYLSMDDRDEQALGTTMLRFARAMYLAGRPDLERKEYSKKLYKLLSGFRSAESLKGPKDARFQTKVETEDQKDALELFARYSSGMIDSEELKKQWAEQVLSKEAPPRRSQEDAREYEVIRRDTGEVIDTIKDWSLKSANETALVKYSGQGFEWDVREKTDAEPEKKLSRRAQIAKRIKERPTVWHVEDTNTGRVLLIAAATIGDAKWNAKQQDPGFERLDREDPDSFFVHPATAKEIKQYMAQQADNKKDSEQVQQRVQDRFGMYRVRWTERRNGQEANDSLRVSAANADSAMSAVRDALQAQGREITSINAVVADSTEDRVQQRATGSAQQREYQIYNRSTGQPVVAFMAASDEYALTRLEQYRQQHPSLDVGVRTGDAISATRNQLPQGEFTGNWQVKDRQGNVVYTFGGVGNSQADANRIAHTWLLAHSDRFENQGPFDVVPEMR